MPASLRKITRDDIIDIGTYAKERAERRKAILPRKKLRRIEVGPHATFYFECYETMLQQVLAADVLSEDPSWKKQRLANIIAQERSRWLLGKLADLFAE